jgi:hypothetical protein
MIGCKDRSMRRNSLEGSETHITISSLSRDLDRWEQSQEQASSRYFSKGTRCFCYTQRFPCETGTVPFDLDVGWVYRRDDSVGRFDCFDGHSGSDFMIIWGFLQLRICNAEYRTVA